MKWVFQPLHNEVKSVLGIKELYSMGKNVLSVLKKTALWKSVYKLYYKKTQTKWSMVTWRNGLLLSTHSELPVAQGTHKLSPWLDLSLKLQVAPLWSVLNFTIATTRWRHLKVELVCFPFIEFHFYWASDLCPYEYEPPTLPNAERVQTNKLSVQCRIWFRGGWVQKIQWDQPVQTDSNCKALWFSSHHTMTPPPQKREHKLWSKKLVQELRSESV